MIDFQPIDSDTVEAAESYRRRKATSVLSVVFTDIADSTALREELGESEYEELREGYDKQVAEIVSYDDAGAVVKGTGDGMLCVFSEPSTAVERCLEIQRAGRGHSVFRLRIGIDLGQVSVRTASGVVADVFGRQVNRAARIQSLAEPGHILSSFNIYDCAVGWLRGDSVAWAGHGLASLKGFKEPVAIHEVYDPRESKPQSSAHFSRPEPTRILFSRSAVRTTKPLPLGAQGWKAALLALKSDLVRLHELWDTDTTHQVDSYTKRIATAIERLQPWAPPELSILWIGESLRSGAMVRSLLQVSGLQVLGVRIADEAFELSQRSPFLLFVHEVTSDADLMEALRFAKWQRANPSGGPVLFLSCIDVEGEHEELSLVSGAALCTAGSVTLLDGIAQVIERLRDKLPFEYIDDAPDSDAKSARREGPPSLLVRLKKLLRP
jgi:class 3 adenylate cyclase